MSNSYSFRMTCSLHWFRDRVLIQKYRYLMLCCDLVMGLSEMLNKIWEVCHRRDRSELVTSTIGFEAKWLNWLEMRKYLQYTSENTFQTMGYFTVLQLIFEMQIEKKTFTNLVLTDTASLVFNQSSVLKWKFLRFKIVENC